MWEHMIRQAKGDMKTNSQVISWATFAIGVGSVPTLSVAVGSHLPLTSRNEILLGTLIAFCAGAFAAILYVFVLRSIRSSTLRFAFFLVVGPASAGGAIGAFATAFVTRNFIYMIGCLTMMIYSSVILIAWRRVTVRSDRENKNNWQRLIARAVRHRVFIVFTGCILGCLNAVGYVFYLRTQNETIGWVQFLGIVILFIAGFINALIIKSGLRWLSRE